MFLLHLNPEVLPKLDIVLPRQPDFQIDWYQILRFDLKSPPTVFPFPQFFHKPLWVSQYFQVLVERLRLVKTILQILLAYFVLPLILILLFKFFISNPYPAQPSRSKLRY